MRENRDSRTAYHAAWRTDLKLETLTHYGYQGELRCAWPNCEIQDIDMLTLDHVNNDGAHHRREMQRLGKHYGRELYSKLKQAGYPAGFQTLCMNHQLKKELMRKRGNALCAEQAKGFIAASMEVLGC